MMSITKKTLYDMIKQEIEAVKADMVNDLVGCLKSEQDIDADVDRLRPEDADAKAQNDVHSTIDETPFIKRRKKKPRAEKVKSQRRADRRGREDAKRKAVFGGPALLDAVGISLDEEDLDESSDKPKGKGRGQHTKPSKTKKNCSVGSPYHSNSTGRFVDPYEERGSWALSAKGKDCARGQFKRTGANKSTKFTKRPCGRDARKVGKNRKCSGDKINENWQRFVEQVEREDRNKIEFEGGVKMTADQLRQELMKELNKMLQGYASELSAQQKRAILNAPERLSDDKLSTFCNSYGTTSINQFLNKTNAIRTMANNIINRYGKQTVRKPEQTKGFDQDLELKSSSSDNTLQSDT